MNPNVADFILIIYKIRFNATFVKEYLQVRGGFKKKEGKFGSLAKTFLTPPLLLIVGIKTKLTGNGKK